MPETDATIALNPETVEVKYGGERHKVPQSWNKLSLEQQLQCYSIIMSDVDNLIEPVAELPAKRILLLEPLCGMKRDFLRMWRTDCIRADRKNGETTFLSELSQLLEITDFLFEEEEPEDETDEEDDNLDKKYSISLTLTENPWPQLKKTEEIKGSDKRKVKVKLFGPNDQLDHMSLYELGTSFTLFEKYLETGDMKFAYRLLATIYRPPKPDTKENREKSFGGDIRLPLIGYEATVDKRMHLMRSLNPRVVQLLIFFFASCREQIIRSWSKIFRKGGDPVSEAYGWGGLILTMAGGLEGFNDVAEKDFAMALQYLSLMEDRRRQEEQARLKRKARRKFTNR